MLSLNRLLISALPIALFGCSLGYEPSAEVGTVGTGEEAEEYTDDSASDMAVEEVRPEDAKVGFEEKYLTFVYDWPDAVDRADALVAYFRQRAQTNLSQLREFQGEDERYADPDYEYRPQYSHHVEWDVAAKSAPLISLASSFYNYSGGAHGIYGRAALLYDMAGDDVIQPVDIFADRVAARNALQTGYCALLDGERSERRGGQKPDPEAIFWDCIDPLEQTLIFHSSIPGGKFDRLTIYAGPYAVGAYAEGDFTIDMPVSAALKAAIRSEYMGSFAVNNDAPVIGELD